MKKFILSLILISLSFFGTAYAVEEGLSDYKWPSKYMGFSIGLGKDTSYAYDGLLPIGSSSKSIIGEIFLGKNKLFHDHFLVGGDIDLALAYALNQTIFNYLQSFPIAFRAGADIRFGYDIAGVLPYVTVGVSASNALDTFDIYKSFGLGLDFAVGKSSFLRSEITTYIDSGLGDGVSSSSFKFGYAYGF